MKQNLAAAVIAGLFFSAGLFAQSDGSKAPEIAPPRPVATPPKVGDRLLKNLDDIGNGEVSRERRQEAYSKLLEGQRYVFMLGRRRDAATAANIRLARQAFQKAAELDPKLAEAYTALAELVLSQPPGDMNEAITLASLAVRIDRDNFGGQRILSRLYTIKSRINEDVLDQANSAKAIAAWKEITRLDPRNAEAWAFLSEFYRRTDKTNDRIEALKSWLSAAAPLETRFYQTMLGREEALSPEAASAKLGGAYLDAGRIKESIEVLNQAVADDPENSDTVAMLGRALESADAATAATSVEAIRQAIYANPESSNLIALLAKVQARTGGLGEAAKVVDGAVARLAEKDKNAAAALQVSLGDIYRDAGRVDEAAAIYKKSLATAGIDENTLATDADRDLAIGVYDRIIRTFKNANRVNDAKLAIDDARKILGDEDSFADRQLIALYRENGRRTEALAAIKFARIRFSSDYGFLRQQAQVLVELGKVNEGVELIRALIGKKPVGPPSPMYDDFTNYLFISMLYSDGKRGAEAIAAANKAYEIAQGEERRQIARLQLATALEKSGDFRSAETTLREILAGSPNNPIAQNNLGYFLADRNEKLDEALRLIQAALKVDPENPSFLDSLAWVYFKMGKFAQAEEQLKKAIAIDSSSSTAHDHLGDIYQKQGKTELARDSWQKAMMLASDPEEVSAIRTKLSKRPAK